LTVAQAAVEGVGGVGDPEQENCEHSNKVVYLLCPLRKSSSCLLTYGRRAL
jgi:hypothetical protein